MKMATGKDGDAGAGNNSAEINYDRVDDTTLEENDLYVVKKATRRVAFKWKAVGGALGIAPADLDTIGGNQQDAEERLSDVLREWLKLNYDHNRNGLPAWRKLVEAIADSAGGSNSRLAQTIARNHPKRAPPPVAPPLQFDIHQSPQPDDTREDPLPTPIDPVNFQSQNTSGEVLLHSHRLNKWKVSLIGMVCLGLIVGGLAVIVNGVRGDTCTLGERSIPAFRAFNVIFGLLCLSFPVLWIIIFTHQRLEEHNRFRFVRKQLERGASIWFVLSILVAVTELIFSFFIAEPVYNNFNGVINGNDNTTTMCSRPVYVTAFVSLTLIYATVIVLLAIFTFYLVFTKRPIKQLQKILRYIGEKLS